MEEVTEFYSPRSNSDNLILAICMVHRYYQQHFWQRPHLNLRSTGMNKTWISHRKSRTVLTGEKNSITIPKPLNRYGWITVLIEIFIHASINNPRLLQNINSTKTHLLLCLWHPGFGGLSSSQQASRNGQRNIRIYFSITVIFPLFHSNATENKKPML